MSFDATKDKTYVVAGVGTYNTAESCESARAARDCGVDGVMAVTPYYSKPPQSGIVAHMTAIADAAELPMMVYNIPGRTCKLIELDTLIELARQKPVSEADLSSIPELQEKTIRRHGAELLAIVAHAAQVDPADWPQHDKVNSLDKQQLALGDCLMALCRVIAEENDIALATLVVRKDIDNLILNSKNSRLTQGWRFTMAGEKLLEFIHGQSSISVANDALQLESR